MADLGLSKLLDSLFSPPTWIKVSVRSSLIEKIYCIAFHNFSTKTGSGLLSLFVFPTFYSQVSILA